MTPTHRLALLVQILAPTRLTRILDVGASPINQPDYHALRAAGLCEVWGFEPQPEEFNRLCAEAGRHEHYLPHAIGDGAEHELRICRSSGFTSLLEPSGAFANLLRRFYRPIRVMERVPMTTLRLDDIDDLPQVDFLKIDVQGSETMVFSHGAAKLADCCCVVTEVAFVPLYENQPLISDQMTALRAQGFDLHKFKYVKDLPVGSELLGELPAPPPDQMIDGDAVFVRGLMALDDQPTEALKHLAILAHGVFDSQSLAMRCLEHLTARGACTPEALAPFFAALKAPA